MRSPGREGLLALLGRTELGGDTRGAEPRLLGRWRAGVVMPDRLQSYGVRDGRWLSHSTAEGSLHCWRGPGGQARSHSLLFRPANSFAATFLCSVQKNGGWLCVYANTSGLSVYARSRASATGRSIRGRHRNSLIPCTLFHPYKEKGWRTGGRRRG